MMAVLADGLDFLKAQSFGSIVSLFWFVLIFDVPRYTLSFAAAVLRRRPVDMAPERLRSLGRISVVIAGNNEADVIEACVRGLWEQTLPPDEIVVVSDGSTDAMTARLRDLKREGLIQRAHGTALRAGKAAAINLAERLCSGDIVVNVDCDCLFDRHALQRIVQPFADPGVGTVCGNILVSNHSKSLVAGFQAIEYLISISLGKAALDLVGQVSCASGAFSAFRRSALRAVGGLDAGGGEDLDVTLRLRRAGWATTFAADAICYTAVPDTLSTLTHQRFRWERDAVRLRYRKHSDVLNPFAAGFRPVELVHQFEFLFFNVIGAAALPFYVVWLFATYGDLAPAILLAAQAGLFVVDTVVFLMAAHATPQANGLALMPLVPGYSLFNGVVMRMIRLAAYLQEWVVDASYFDPYVPDKVHKVRE
ncbi:cellulose synthase/poly-beta-1,6-N-acetylglucosamine synthase-like glycosyltransferase [Rhodobium orientis]|nr:glycosyltransferase [Rhodobium orientis]MBB4301292.1 cellulose synthase/poly-beta-1,6-N-acetylglucosamine synthase-like glycosyltransferase [Rhodobium orientis]